MVAGYLAFVKFIYGAKLLICIEKEK